MKTNSQKTNNTIWLGAAIGFALMLLVAVPRTASAQQWNTNGNNISNANSGNVGIGTSTPSSPLVIAGNEPSGDYATLRVKPTVTHGGIVIDSANDTSQVHLRFYKNGVPKWQFRVPFQESEDLRIYSWAASADVLSINPVGNIGIGTTSPNPIGVSPSVYGRVVTISNPSAGARALLELWTNAAPVSGQAIGQINFLSGGSPTQPGAAILSTANGTTAQTGNLRFWTASTGTDFAERMLIDHNGNVGIGTTSPQSKLEVSGSGIIRVTEGSRATPTSGVGLELSANSNGSYVGAFDRSAWAYRPLSFYGSPYYFEGGNVGIGTTSPQAKLEVDGSGIIRITEGSRATPTSGAGLELSANSTSSYVGAFDRSAWAYRPLSFYGANYYFENGNVGIGTAPNAQYKLDVAGNINSNATITGTNIVARYQDVAEWVPSSEKLSGGTVVVLDSTKSNQVIASTVSYDTRVAGVISERPGLALGERAGNKVLVATTGRVRVKVDASRAPVHIGDLLVTSDKPGVAMKSEPVNIGGVQLHRPGTLIGKALEPLAKGSGEILVLLSLQ